MARAICALALCSGLALGSGEASPPSATLPQFPNLARSADALAEETAASANSSALSRQPRASLRGSTKRALGQDDFRDYMPNAQDLLHSALQVATWAPCADKEGCLRRIDDFLLRAPRQSGFRTGGSMLQTFGRTPPGGGGPCGPYCSLAEHCVTGAGKCRFDVYDNAVAVIYFTKRGNIDRAREILDAFRSLLYADGHLKLLYAAYSLDGIPSDYRLDTGNNAWAALAFGHFAAETGDTCMAAIGRAMLHKIVDETSCDDQLSGFMGRMPRGAGNYRATEHNIDMYALARLFGETDIQDRARRFVGQMFAFDAEHPQTYATSTKGEQICDSRPASGLAIAADAQFWTLLADADGDPNRKRSSLEYSLRPSSEGGFVEIDLDFLGDNSTLSGIRFTDQGYGAQWENTASAVMGIGFYDAMYAGRAGSSAQSQTPQALAMKNSLLHMIEEYGSVLASVRGGNYQAYYDGNPAPFPGGSDTGIGWAYLRYPHSAATAWTGLMLLEENPFALLAGKSVPGAGAPVDGACPART